MSKLTYRQLVKALLSTPFVDTLNIKGFAPNYKARGKINNYIFCLSLEQDFSHYGFRKYDYYLRLIIRNKHSYPSNDRQISWRLSFDHIERGNISQLQSRVFKNIRLRLKRLVAQMNRPPLQESNGRTCYSFKSHS